MTDPAGRPIVVGVNATAESRFALEVAIGEARFRARPLRLVYAESLILGGERLPEESGILEAALDVAREQVGEGSVSGIVVNERPAPGILDQATGAELIVVGSRARSAIASVVLGSVSSAVAVEARCPVLVARPSREHSPLGPRVLVGVDGSELSSRAVAFAFEEASNRELPLVAVHCWQVDHPDAAQWDAELFAARRNEHLMWMSESIAGFRDKYPDVAVTTNVLEGRAAVLLTELSRGAELLVVGSRGRGGLRGMALGSVSQSLLHHAYCSVAVVRAVQE
ncbi:universal stress protein [Actinopolymorpha alba]|uniref:universal stress protein n=1 Tax=Actinopolymorpha alba TaxID=533267 RepID=UPI000361B67E|nr:universal stress protein [Actinopolymorpha alba]